MTRVVLRTKNLTKSFKNRKVVEDLCFEVQEGEIFGFLGPNGAGKSTTIRLMLSLVKPDLGDVEIFGKSVSEFKNHALRNVGALIEEPTFYKNLPARRNLQLLADLDGVAHDRIDDALDIVGLNERGDDKVKAYSHGMKQRLGIAQALLSRPKLLILDEPTAGLDPRGMKEVRELIGHLAMEGITIFLSSHLLHEVEQICTSMAIINLGKLMTVGKVKDLLQETDLFTTEIHATPLDKARDIIIGLEFVSTVDKLGQVLKVTASTQQLSQVTKALVEKGVEVTAVIPRTSLEDYYLSLTGNDSSQA